MVSRIVKINALFLFVFSFLLFSCEKDTVTTTENFVNENEELLAFHGFTGEHGPQGPRIRFLNRCFDLVYPITIAFPDGTTVEAEDMAALRTLLMEWRENNPGATERPTLVFPVDVTLEDGSVMTVEDHAGLRALAADCEGPGRPNLRRCFDLVFPITVSFPDGTTAEAADAEALRTLLSEWHDSNPDAEDRPTFVFPIEVETRSGEIVTIEDAEAFRELLHRCHQLGQDCNGHGDGPGNYFGGPCFHIVFPVTIEFPDGTTAEAADRAELHQLIREWRAENEGAEGRPTIAFPHDVELEDGTIVTVNSPEEVRALLEECHP